MAIRWGMILVAASAAFPILAGEDLATSAAFGGVHMNTSGRPTVISSQSDMTALAAWPVTYREGETVTATASDGTTRTLADNAAASGAAAFAPDAGGLWRLVNSNGETALVGVSWSVFGESWTLDFVTGSRVGMHTIGDGPDRKVKKGDVPPVAYSGDDWCGDVSKSVSVTFTPPTGSGISPTTLQLNGTGATTFTFTEPGRWTVSLTMADGTTRTATLFVYRAMFVISFT